MAGLRGAITFHPFLHIFGFSAPKLPTFLPDSSSPSSFLFIPFFPFLSSFPFIISFHFFNKNNKRKKKMKKKGKEEMNKKEEREEEF